MLVKKRTYCAAFIYNIFTMLADSFLLVPYSFEGTKESFDYIGVGELSI